MEKLKEQNLLAYNWLSAKERPAKHWCRAYFSTYVDCDIMINNICESFNGWIVDAKGKSPVTMFEELRIKLMKRIANRRKKMEAYHDNICPKVRMIMEKNKEKAATNCISIFNGGDIAEVNSIQGTTNVVDIARRTCSCRRYDLSGLPCKHDISAIYVKRHDPDDYVSACYMKSTYMSIYNNLIQPINIMDLWSQGANPPIQPPQYSRQLGRPKIARIKDASEKLKDGCTTIRRVQRSLRCGNCNQIGHNKTTCQRHLPPKEKGITASANKKRKLNTHEGQSAEKQPAKKRTPPMTPNELRQKIKERNEYMRFRKANLKASKLEANKTIQNKARPATSTQQNSRFVQGSNPSTKQAATTSRSSQRIRKPSSKVSGK